MRVSQHSLCIRVFIVESWNPKILDWGVETTALLAGSETCMHAL